MFVMLREDRVKQPLYRSTRIVRAWRPTTNAELSRATSCWPDRIPPGTQWQAFPHRLVRPPQASGRSSHEILCWIGCVAGRDRDLRGR
jgi:hypothetical protein